MDSRVLDVLDEILVAVENIPGGGGSDSGWVDATSLLTHDWIPNGGFTDATPSYRKINGVVYLTGMLDGESVTNDDTVALTMPEGSRPACFQRWGFSPTDGTYTWEMTTDGVLYGTSAGWAETPLDMVIFPAAAP